MDYDDFVLRISPAAESDRFVISAKSATAGEASSVFTPPFSETELENFVLKVGLTRRGVRKINSTEWRAAQIFGQKLFTTLFSDDIRSTFFASRNDALREGRGLRVKFILDAPALANYPWEYLYDPSLNRFLSLYTATPLVRYVELSTPPQALHVVPPLRVLVLASSPTDFEPLDIAREKNNLDNALTDLSAQQQIAVDWLATPSLEALRAQLLKQQYHIFHFIGHGGYDQAAHDGVLIFEDESRRGKAISGERLAVLLGNHPTLRLAILNSCEGARNSVQDPFGGAALTLVRSGGLGAVVAMQFEITDTASIAFSRGFYSALASGKPVDASVSEARLAIFSQDNDVEWGTPVLYLRSPNGIIFVPHPTRDAAASELLRSAPEQRARERQRHIETLLVAARASMARGELDDADKSLAALVALDPSNGEAFELKVEIDKSRERVARETPARNAFTPSDRPGLPERSAVLPPAAPPKPTAPSKNYRVPLLVAGLVLLALLAGGLFVLNNNGNAGVAPLLPKDTATTQAQAAPGLASTASAQDVNSAATSDPVASFATQAADAAAAKQTGDALISQYAEATVSARSTAQSALAETQEPATQTAVFESALSAEQTQVAGFFATQTAEAPPEPVDTDTPEPVDTDTPEPAPTEELLPTSAPASNSSSTGAGASAQNGAGVRLDAQGEPRDGRFDGVTFTVETLNITDLATGAGQEIFSSSEAGENLYSSAWSPDGNRILVTSGGCDPCVGRLQAMDRAGSNRQVITSRIVQYQAFNKVNLALRDAIWSPDGKRIAFFDILPDGNRCPFLINPDGTKFRKLNLCEADDHPRFWSVDGKWVIAWSERGGLYAYDVDGSRRVPLAELGGIPVYDQRYYPWRITDAPACSANHFWACE